VCPSCPRMCRGNYTHTYYKSVCDFRQELQSTGLQLDCCSLRDKSCHLIDVLLCVRASFAQFTVASARTSWTCRDGQLRVWLTGPIHTFKSAARA